MDAQSIRQKITSGDMSDQELLDLLKGSHAHKQKGSFLKTILKGFNDAYTAPAIWRLILQAVLILLVIVGTLMLAYWGKIDNAVASVIMAFLLGFLFGKFR